MSDRVSRDSNGMPASKGRISTLLAVENADDSNDFTRRVLMDAFHGENG